MFSAHNLWCERCFFPLAVDYVCLRVNVPETGLMVPRLFRSVCVYILSNHEQITRSLSVYIASWLHLDIMSGNELSMCTLAPHHFALGGGVLKVVNGGLHIPDSKYIIGWPRRTARAHIWTAFLNKALSISLVAKYKKTRGVWFYSVSTTWWDPQWNYVFSARYYTIQVPPTLLHVRNVSMCERSDETRTRFVARKVQIAVANK